MNKKPIAAILVMLLLGFLHTTLSVRFGTAWSNGGYSDDPSNPAYGTHDWIGEHALDWLPEEEKQYVEDNLAAYLYGTELPDNGGAPDGIGDTAKHHIYYWSNGSLQDDASAVRAYEEYNNTLDFLRSGDPAKASKTAGIMSHYIVDLAVFGHVMSSGTDWGPEIHHSDYETYVNQRTSNYTAEFNTYLSFDGELNIISAYDAAKELAYDTTFDVDGDLTCAWMDQNYNWSDPVFKNRCGESLNLAVNYVTDVLHTLYVEAYPPPVQNIDTDLDYETIQEAIDALETLDGHTITVNSGTYYEHVVVNKSISLVGEDRSTTVIDGGGNGTVLQVTANNTIISGFTIRESRKPDVEYTPSTDTGILVFPGDGQIVRNTTIIDNSIVDNHAGIFIRHSNGSTIVGNKLENNFIGIGVEESIHSSIDRNTISKNAGGIWLRSGGNSVMNNTILSNLAYSVQLDGSSFSIVDGNHIEDNGYGIELDSATSNNITDNIIIGNAEGIFLASFCTSNIISSNDINSNFDVGITLSNDYGDGNIITENNLANNGKGISVGSSANGSIIFHNNFINNTESAVSGNYTNYNLWDNGYPSGGNYWSDYNGTDLNSGPHQNVTGSDGFGDTPYIIAEDNQDNYPFISVLELTPPTADAGPDQRVYTDIMVTFNGSASWDELGIVSCEWDLGDGANATSMITNHTYTEPGTYSVTLTVQDGSGKNDTDTITAKVNMLGDINGDKIIDISDAVTTAISFGSMKEDNPDTSWNETKSWDPFADFNNDGIVDVIDLVIIGVNFGKTA